MTKNNYKRLGDCIEKVDVRNTENLNIPLMGLTIDKKFISSVANTVGTDLSNYKIVFRNQFACSLMQVSRDGKIPVARLEDEKVMMSPAYPIFQVTNSNILMPEYLEMWFKRAEFDRECAYYAVGGVRGNLTWEDFCDLELPIPSIEKQREIVADYQAVENKIKTNEAICEKLEETARAIYREWFEEQGDSWEIKKLNELAEIKAGGDKPLIYSSIKTEECHIPIYSNGITNNGLYGYTNNAIYPGGSITISARGTIGFCVLRDEPFVGIVRLLVVTPIKKELAYYLLDYLRTVDFSDSGSVQSQLTIPQISDIDILLPPLDELIKYHNIAGMLGKQISLMKVEIQKLHQLQALLLGRMTRVEK